jgi:hypothetical protein
VNDHRVPSRWLWAEHPGRQNVLRSVDSERGLYRLNSQAKTVAEGTSANRRCTARNPPGLRWRLHGPARIGVLWLATATLATWGSSRVAILFVIIAGMFIFPLTRLGLAALGYRGVITPGNPLNALVMQVAFTRPLSLPVVGAALCALLVSAGLGLALYAPPSFALGAWVTGGVLLAFAFAGRRVALREARAQTQAS